MSPKQEIKPEILPRRKKELFLLKLSEDDFRDKVIRPLFYRNGLKDGRDTCGKEELGKDAIFIATDQLGINNVYVIQSKKGNLNLSRKVSQNIEEAIVQLRTALATQIVFSLTREKKYPSKAILCASGKINEKAKRHIVETVNDPRLEFLDSDDLIPQIDEAYQELWLGIDTDILPYLKSLKKRLESPAEYISIADFIPGQSAVLDTSFVPMSIYRPNIRPVKFRGKIQQKFDFEEFTVSGLLERKDKLVFIVGEAGSGKSTAIKRLAYTLACRGLDAGTAFLIPVLLRSSDVLKKLDLSLIDICYLETNRIAGTVKPCFSIDDLVKGNVFVFIDALDELANNSERATILQKAIEFNEIYPNCLLVITSREYPTVNKLAEEFGFKRYTISPINHKQAEQIIRRLEKDSALPPDVSEEVLRRIQDIHGMALNPLLVTVFAATTEYSRKDIPANITELFKKYTELMLGRWDATKGLAQQYHAPLKDFILRRIAYEMQRRETTRISIKEFMQIAQDELTKRSQKAEIPILCSEIIERSGLLNTIDDYLEFRHLLLQEFFAGRGIPSTEAISLLATKEWWQRAIIFYFGEKPHDSVGIKFLVSELSSAGIQDLFTAARTIGLALQACYLVETEDRAEVLRWVIEKLSDAKDYFLEDLDVTGKYPIARFAFYYLTGRDSVACSILDERSDDFLRLLKQKPEDFKEINTFWIIVGLLEIGLLEKAERLIKKFRPKDKRLLFAVYLGSVIIQNLRITSRENKAIASRISAGLLEGIRGFREQLLSEFKTELLEMRKGRIEALTLPPHE